MSECLCLALQHIEMRLAALESGLKNQGALEKMRVKPARRKYPELVPLEPEPGEDQIYGDATPLIGEWRQVMTEFLGDKARLCKAATEERLLELEIEIIDKHGLTLPHRTYPLDRSERRDAVRRKQQVLEEVRVDRARAQLRLWLN